MATVEQAQGIIARIVQAIVDQPEAVILTIHGESPRLVLSIWLASEDFGRVIGKQGRTARSIRTIALGMGMKSGIRLSLDFKEAPLGPNKSQA